MHKLRHFLIAAALATGAALPVAAQDGEVPYWASIRATEVNMRVGPSEEYRISWVYHRQHLPLKVLRKMEGWRLVEDQDGARGWMNARFLTPQRSAVVIGTGPADMRERGDPAARLLWRLAPGVLGLLGDCADGWCALTVGQRVGYVPEARLWGDGAPQ
jgi:SH3-like domain-containing protein